MMLFCLQTATIWCWLNLMDEYGNKQDNTKYNLGLFGGVFASDFDFEEINDGDIFLEAWSVCRIDDLFRIV